MTTYHPRSAWTHVARPVEHLVPLVAAGLKGVAVHYTGDPGAFGAAPSLAESCRRLEGERKFHTDPPPAGRGWSDIAYQVAIDQAGRVFDCRGIAYRSAANGNTTTNSTHGAVTFLIGVKDTPTPALVRAFQDWRRAHWLPRWPRAVAVVGHRDLYGTACPGNSAYQLVRSGTLAATTAPPEDDVITTADADLIVGRLLGNARFQDMLRTLPWAGGWPIGKDPKTGEVINEDAGVRLARASYPERAAPAIAEAVIDKLTADILAGLDAAVTLEAIKTAVREVLVEGTGGTP